MNTQMIKLFINQYFKLNLSMQLLGVILFALICGNYLSLALKSGLYALSLLLEEILLLVMPVIIFSFLFSCLISLKRKALKLVSFLLLAVCFSNFISAMLAYGFGNLILPKMNLDLQISQQASKQLLPLWNFKLPYTISSEYALIMALGLGVIFSIYPSTKIERVAQKLREALNLLLEKTFTPLLPLFILGFVIKMQHEGSLSIIVQSYGPIFAIILVFYIIYLICFYYIVARFNLKQAYLYFRNVLPSGIMGFTTMSSIITMPITLRAAEKNTKNPIAAEIIIPFTVNIHMIGDSLAIPIMAMAILLSFGQPLPMPEKYLLFASYFVLCRFAVAAVPGGGILIMLPILESYLGFSAEMSALITTLFILFDPFATAVNVIGNGGFAILTSRIFKERQTVLSTISS